MDFTTSPFKFSNFVKAMDDITNPNSYAHGYEAEVRNCRTIQQLCDLKRRIEKDNKLAATSKNQLVIIVKHMAWTKFQVTIL